MSDPMTRATLRVRAGMLRSMVAREARLEKLYGKRLAALQRKLRNATAGEVPVRVTRELRKLIKEVVPEIETAIHTGTDAGVATAEAQVKTIFGKKELIGSLASTTNAAKMAMASKRILGETYVDKIPLSSRLWKNADATGKAMATQIQGAIQAGHGMERIAKDIVKTKPPLVRMPKYIADLEKAARRAADLGQPNILADAVTKYKRQIDKLGSVAGPLFDATTNTNKLIKGLEGATTKQIDAHVKRFMTEKARQHAITVARTETIHAHRTAYYESVKDQPGVEGIRWNLAFSHPIGDICDVYANQDNDGLGPGGYKYGNIPSNPHPNCMCYQTAIVDPHHFERKVAKKKGIAEPPKPWLSGKKQNGAEWLRKQPTKKQLEILGPTRQRMLTARRAGVVDPKTGKIALVRDLKRPLGKPTPKPAPKRTATTTRKRVTKPKKAAKRVTPPRPTPKPPSPRPVTAPTPPPKPKPARPTKAKAPPRKRATKAKKAVIEFGPKKAPPRPKRGPTTTYFNESEVIAPKLYGRIKGGRAPVILKRGPKGFKPVPVDGNTRFRQRTDSVIATENRVTGHNVKTTKIDHRAHNTLLKENGAWLEPLPLKDVPPDPYAAQLLKGVKGKAKPLPHMEYNTGYKGKVPAGAHLSEAETIMKNFDRETLCAWDAEGNLIFRKTVNDATQVRMTGAEGAFLKKHAMYSTHNHPSGSAFSTGDAMWQPGMNLVEFRAVASKSYKGPGHNPLAPQRPKGDVFRMRYNTTKPMGGAQKYKRHRAGIERAYERSDAVHRKTRKAMAEHKWKREVFVDGKGWVRNPEIPRGMNWNEAMVDTLNDVGKTSGFKVDFLTNAERLKGM